MFTECVTDRVYRKVRLTGKYMWNTGCALPEIFIKFNSLNLHCTYATVVAAVNLLC